VSVKIAARFDILVFDALIRLHFVGRRSSPVMVQIFLHIVQTDSAVHPTSYPMSAGALSRGKAVEAWSWPLFLAEAKKTIYARTPWHGFMGCAGTTLTFTCVRWRFLAEFFWCCLTFALFCLLVQCQSPLWHPSLKYITILSSHFLGISREYFPKSLPAKILYFSSFYSKDNSFFMASLLSLGIY
jgi:hypothetical protein